MPCQTYESSCTHTNTDTKAYRHKAQRCHIKANLRAAKAAMETKTTTTTTATATANAQPGQASRQPRQANVVAPESGQTVCRQKFYTQQQQRTYTDAHTHTLIHTQREGKQQSRKKRGQEGATRRRREAQHGAEQCGRWRRRCSSRLRRCWRRSAVQRLVLRTYIHKWGVCVWVRNVM